nr:unnamed protein product [Callosobruchus analis]
MDPRVPVSQHSGSRCNRMVSLALNIQLKEKLNVIRSSKQVNKVKRNEDTDYVPGLSNGSGNARGNESSDPSYKFSQVTPPKQIHVLSDVIVVPKSVNQPGSNTLVTSYSTVQDCEENLQENLCNTLPEEIDFNPVQVFIRENILQDIINKSVQKSESKLYTKTGQLRKRKRFEEPLAERRKEKIESYRRAHEVKGPCQCKLNCTQKISHTRQRDINGQYWQLPKEQQKQFIWDSMKQFKKNRSTTKNKTSPREYTYKYYLTSGEAEKVSVCKTFCLATLGYEKENHRMLKNLHFSYESYRKIVTNDLNISFANLGNEECWECEEFEIHKKATSHEANVENCDVCKTWKIHKLKATNARKNYQEDAVKIKQEDEIFVAADLQKVNMLPRLETFKEILFTPRIVVYNESFVPLGKKSTTYPWAVLRHEGVAGRSKDDIISTFYAFFRVNRDIKHITIWLDNCSSQNKNWSLFSFFVYIVNSSEVALENLTIKFFEPGHTFMAADSFHHQVELSLKRKKKVYDFDDFCEVVERANSARVVVIKMQITQFFSFTDYTSKYKLQKLDARIYLKDMVCIHFKRGNHFVSYKTEIENEFIDSKDIFMKKYVNGTLTQPQARNICRGVSLDRKNNLISKLKKHIPENRMKFWEDLPISEDGFVEDVDD